jgi:hypothetical protein
MTDLLVGVSCQSGNIIGSQAGCRVDFVGDGLW